jgi:hypothetical protein
MQVGATNGRAMTRSERSVTLVYLDPGVVALEPERAEAGSERVTVPGAVEALGYLADGQHELVLLGDDAEAVVGSLPIEIRAEAELPVDPEPGSWLITDDPEGCMRRPRGLRTILVGPKRAPSHRPMARCDLEARDLSTAVIEILSREAMA